MGISKFMIGGLATLLASSLAFAQPAQPAAHSEGSLRAAYRLGPDDVITIRAADAEEISEKPIKIGVNGFIHLPMVGRLQATGLTAEELEKELVTELKRFIRNPEVSVTVVEQRSQPVSVIGAVRSPGVQQLQGQKTLVEVLSLAGGVTEAAGYSVKITRQKEMGPIPLPKAAAEAGGQFSVAEVNLKDIMSAKNPEENIFIMPNDVISVPRAEMIYVIGEVKRAGGFILGEQAHMSVLQALSLASGLEKTASSSKAKILRATASNDMKRTEIGVNLKNILTGKDQDLPMEPQDILFVPGSKSKTAAIRAIEVALQLGTGVAIYRF